jgi:hypothetical protein
MSFDNDENDFDQVPVYETLMEHSEAMEYTNCIRRAATEDEINAVLEDDFMESLSIGVYGSVEELEAYISMRYPQIEKTVFVLEFKNIDKIILVYTVHSILSDKQGKHFLALATHKYLLNGEDVTCLTGEYEEVVLHI